MSKYVVKASCFHQPSSRKWKHPRMRVAVLEVEDGAPPPKMISTHARGVVRVVRVWEDLYAGTSGRDQYSRAWKAACEMAERLGGSE